MKRMKLTAIEKARKEQEERLQKAMLKLSKEHGLEDVLKTLNYVADDDCFSENDKRWYRDKFGEIMQDKGYELIQCTGSLAEQYKIEAFREQLAENPYQLKLIA